MDYKQKLSELLLTAARQNASDLHIAVGRRPTLRIDGALISLQQEPILTPEDAQGLSLALLTPLLRKNHAIWRRGFYLCL
jgi:twitching motility protein PilT